MSKKNFNYLRLQTGFFPVQRPFARQVLVLFPTRYRPLVHVNCATCPTSFIPASTIKCSLTLNAGQVISTHLGSPSPLHLPSSEHILLETPSSL